MIDERITNIMNIEIIDFGHILSIAPEFSRLGWEILQEMPMRKLLY